MGPAPPSSRHSLAQPPAAPAPLPHGPSEIHASRRFILTVAEKALELRWPRGDAVLDLRVPAMLPNP